MTAAQTAGDKETARSLMHQGDEKRKAGKLESALEDYRAAHAIMKLPVTGIDLAETHAALGQLVEARDVALAIGRMPRGSNEPEVSAEARERASALAETLEQRIPSATFVVEGPSEYTLRVDGTQVPQAALAAPRKLNPGKHEVAVEAGGFAGVTQSFSLKEGESRTVTLNLVADPNATAPASPAAPSPGPTGPDPSADSGGSGVPGLAWVGFGVGALGVGVGSVSGVLSLGKASSAKDVCDGNECPRAAKDDIDASKSLATVSNVGFAVGIVGIGVGIVALLTSGGGTSTAAQASPEVVPVVGLTGAGVAGRF